MNKKLKTAWHNMMARCYYKKGKSFKDYGARGIKVCKRWHDFKNSLEDMGYPENEKMQLDRIDNEKGYSKKNCRWVTKSVQGANRRSWSDTGKGIARQGKKFKALITVEKKVYHIGTFENAELAREAYMAVKKEWYGFSY